MTTQQNARSSHVGRAIEEQNAKAAGEARQAQEARVAAARQIIADEGLSIQHFRTLVVPPNFMPNLPTMVHPRGGITVAYRQLKDNSFVEIATAICSEDDFYSRKLGKALVAERFAAGNVIMVPNVFASPKDLVEYMFGELTIKPATVTISAD